MQQWEGSIAARREVLSHRRSEQGQGEESTKLKTAVVVVILSVRYSGRVDKHRRRLLRSFRYRGYEAEQAAAPAAPERGSVVAAATGVCDAAKR